MKMNKTKLKTSLSILLLNLGLSIYGATYDSAPVSFVDGSTYEVKELFQTFCKGKKTILAIDNKLIYECSVIKLENYQGKLSVSIIEEDIVAVGVYYSMSLFNEIELDLAESGHEIINIDGALIKYTSGLLAEYTQDQYGDYLLVHYPVNLSLR